MEILANLGKLSDGRTALIIKDAYNPNFVLAHNYDPDGEENRKWTSARYFDGILTDFCREILLTEVGTSSISSSFSFDRLFDDAEITLEDFTGYIGTLLDTDAEEDDKKASCEFLERLYNLCVSALLKKDDGKENIPVKAISVEIETDCGGYDVNIKDNAFSAKDAEALRQMIAKETKKELSDVINDKDFNPEELFIDGSSLNEILNEMELEDPIQATNRKIDEWIESQSKQLEFSGNCNLGLNVTKLLQYRCAF